MAKKKLTAQEIALKEVALYNTMLKALEGKEAEFEGLKTFHWHLQFLISERDKAQKKLWEAR